MKKKTFMVALTGGIGCGKTFVLQAFSRCGAAVVSADAVARDLRSRPEVASRMADILGSDVMLPDGSGIDAAKAADRIFSDPEAKAAVEELMHPLIRGEIIKIGEDLPEGNGPRILVAEIPLLFESGWDVDFDCTAAVWSSSSEIPGRMAERCWSSGEYSRRAASQLSAEEKLQRACFGIINNGSADSVERQCAELMNIWITMED